MIQAALHTSYTYDWIVSTLESLPPLRRTDTPFCGLPWFEAWLLTMDTTPPVVTFNREGVCVGVLFLGTVDRRIGPFSWKTGLVNQVGIQDFDQVWIEHNSIICPKNMERGCIDAFFRLIPLLGIDELEVSMTDSESHWLEAAKASEWEAESLPVYAASKSLKGVSSLLTTYSKNTRYQINRAIRLLSQKYGDINVAVAVTDEEKANFFSGLSELHIQRWQHTDEGSGFTNPAFVRHHQHLLYNAPEITEIVRVNAGETILGYCLNFICDNHVSFYCSGIQYSDDDNKFKPGYVVHHVLMQEYASRGMLAYDFLGGFSQYKASLSDTTYELHMIKITSPDFRGRALSKLRTLKKQLHSVTERLASR